MISKTYTISSFDLHFYCNYCQKPGFLKTQAEIQIYLWEIGRLIRGILSNFPDTNQTLKKVKLW